MYAMKYSIVKNVIQLLEDFENINDKRQVYSNDIEGFKEWISANFQNNKKIVEPNWEGKEMGRSPESVINTLILHMNRYAKSYSKSAIYGSDFSTQEDFIYLINLKAFGSMSKMDLIKKNVHEKPVGIQIINRLINQNWIEQTDSLIDKRSKVLKITQQGLEALDSQMDKIRQASTIVTGDLTYDEKMELIVLLNKLNEFHRPIYDKNIEVEHLLTEITQTKN